MIGIDTNVLLHAVMADDRLQTPRAQRFLAARSGDDPALINSVVLAEFVWTLRVHYEMPPDKIAGILRDLVESDAYAFVDRPSVLEALQYYEEGTGSFTDRLIAEINYAQGGFATATFDRKAAKHAPFVAIP